MDQVKQPAIMPPVEVPTHRFLHPAVRTVAGLLILFLLLTWIGGLPIYIKSLLSDPNSILSILFSNAWSPQAVENAASELGIAPSLIGWYWLVIEIIMALGFSSAGLFIFFRKKDAFGAFLSLNLVLIGTRITGNVNLLFAFSFPVLLGVMEFLFNYSFFGFVSLLFLFPNGRFVPGWSKWLLPVMALIAVGVTATTEPTRAGNIWIFTLFMSTFGAGVLAQVYRYLRVATLQERLQSKWALLSFVIYLLLAFITPLLNFNIADHNLPPTGMDLLSWMVFYALLTLGSNLFILALAIAIFRYRLYDIEIIIHRTLVYTLVTAGLGLVFFGSIILFQSLFVLLTGERSQLAVVISTLAIAALFSPFRRRAQEVIDRRFYRQKFDAARMLASFSDSLRDNLDLEGIKTDLHQVIQSTFRPVSQVIWLRPAANARKSRKLP